MGSDEFFKKRRETEKRRKHEYLKPKASSYLIVTEGKKTEPLYFRGLKKLIEEKIGGNIDVKDASKMNVGCPNIQVEGTGSSTGKLIEITEQLVKSSKVMYKHIWVVFDKDDFEDFDEAIKLGEEKGYNIAWSNQCFEYWLYLHFNYSDSALHRDEWSSKLDEIFKQYKLGDGKYKKNYENIYQLVDKYDGVNTAIKYAESRIKDFDKSLDAPSAFDPGTTVHLLVKELKKYIDE